MQTSPIAADRCCCYAAATQLIVIGNLNKRSWIALRATIVSIDASTRADKLREKPSLAFDSASGIIDSADPIDLVTADVVSSLSDPLASAPRTRR